MAGGTLDERVRAALQRHPAVGAVDLVGSRARGESTPYSDWDFHVHVTDFSGLPRSLPALVEELGPVAQLWDPLSRHHVYALLLPGPVKIDLLFDAAHSPAPPWTLTKETLPEVDAHLWDWTWWLVSKRYRGEDTLVRDELHKLYGHLLEPAGTADPPATIEQAVSSWLASRNRLESRFDVSIPRTVEQTVLPAIRRAGASRGGDLGS